MLAHSTGVLALCCLFLSRRDRVGSVTSSLLHVLPPFHRYPKPAQGILELAPFFLTSGKPHPGCCTYVLPANALHAISPAAAAICTVPTELRCLPNFSAHCKFSP